MSSLEEIDLSEAVRMYAISNTPIFLMKRLKADSATAEISRNFSGDQILAALRGLVDSPPANSSDYVRPYVYLVALSQLHEIRFLRAAVDIKGHEKWDWYEYIGRVLLDTYLPVTVTTVVVQTAPVSPRVQDTAAVNFEVLEFSNQD
jgi:hypothetical protein